MLIHVATAVTMHWWPGTIGNDSVELQVDLPSWINFPDYERSNWLNSIVGACALCSYLASTAWESEKKAHCCM